MGLSHLWASTLQSTLLILWAGNNASSKEIRMTKTIKSTKDLGRVKIGGAMLNF